MGEVPLLTGLGPTMVACWWQEWQLLKTVIVVCWLLIVDGYRIFPLSRHVTQLLILQYYRSSYAVRNSSTNQVFSQLDPSFWLATVVPTSVLFISSASSSVFVLLRGKNVSTSTESFTIVEVLCELVFDSDSGVEHFCFMYKSVHNNVTTYNSGTEMKFFMINIT